MGSNPTEGICVVFVLRCVAASETSCSLVQTSVCVCVIVCDLDPSVLGEGSRPEFGLLRYRERKAPFCVEFGRVSLVSDT